MCAVCSVVSDSLRLPGSPVHEIFQERRLEWVAISHSRGSSWPRDWTLVSCVFCIGRQSLYHCNTWASQYPQYLVVIVIIHQCKRHKRCGFDPWVGKISWRRAQQPTPVGILLPGESAWTEEPGRLKPIASQRVGHDWSNLTCYHHMLFQQQMLGEWGFLARGDWDTRAGGDRNSLCLPDSPCRGLWEESQPMTTISGGAWHGILNGHCNGSWGNWVISSALHRGESMCHFGQVSSHLQGTASSFLKSGPENEMLKTKVHCELSSGSPVLQGNFPHDFIPRWHPINHVCGFSSDPGNLWMLTQC